MLLFLFLSTTKTLSYPLRIAQDKMARWIEQLIAILPNLIIALIIFILFWFIGKWVGKSYIKVHLKILEKKQDTHIISSSTERRMPIIIAGALRVLFIILGIIIVIESLNLGGVLSKYLAGMGIIGIILGVALQGIASSLFAGLLINIERPFQVGDDVMINEIYGCVEDIGFITTKLTAITGEIVFVPNQIIFTRPFNNLTASGKRRIVLNAGVFYNDDLERVRSVTLDELAKCPFIEMNPIPPMLPPMLVFTQIGSYTYDFSIRFWIEINAPKITYLTVQSEVIIALKKRYEKENINLAYPIQTIEFNESNAKRILQQLTDKPAEKTHSS